MPPGIPPLAPIAQKPEVGRAEPSIVRGRIVVVEPDLDVRRHLVHTITELGFAVVGQAGDADHAEEPTAALRPDAVLMALTPEGTARSIEVATVIQEHVGVPVIFLTAHTDQETLSRARIAQPYGCIVKPFKSVDVNAAIELALYKHARNTEVINQRDHLHTLASKSTAPPFFLRHNGRHIRLDPRNIHFVESMKDYVALHMKDKRYVAHCSLKSMVARLPSNDFIRVHRSFLVRVDKIASVEGPDIILDENKRVIPIGETYTAEVMRRLTNG